MGVPAAVCLYLVFLTGDLGAPAVWAGRLHAGGGFGFAAVGRRAGRAWARCPRSGGG